MHFLTRSLPARSTKWNLDTTVVQSPLPSSTSGLRGRIPRELAGLMLLPFARDMAAAKLGVGDRPKVGEETRVAGDPACIDPGRISLEGDPFEGMGELLPVRGGELEPENFF
jgi:hypothetical protein